MKRLFGEIAKVEPQDDGTIKVYGVASAPTRDAHGEVVTANAMQKAIGDYLRFPAVREMHDTTKAAGRAVEIGVDDDGKTSMVAHVVDPVAVKKVQAGVYSGFSIGGRVKKRSSEDRTIIDEIDLVEISLVDRPSCPDASITMWKSEEGGESEPEARFPREEYAKSADEIGDLTGAEGDETQIEKRTFTADQRRKDAERGSALPDGSFPIENKADLRNAIHAYGRAKDKAKAKAHIKARARALGAADELPEEWKGEKSADELAAQTELLVKGLAAELDKIESRGDATKADPEPRQIPAVLAAALLDLQKIEGDAKGLESLKALISDLTKDSASAKTQQRDERGRFGSGGGGSTEGSSSEGATSGAKDDGGFWGGGSTVAGIGIGVGVLLTLAGMPEIGIPMIASSIGASRLVHNAGGAKKSAGIAEDLKKLSPGLRSIIASPTTALKAAEDAGIDFEALLTKLNSRSPKDINGVLEIIGADNLSKAEGVARKLGFTEDEIAKVKAAVPLMKGDGDKFAKLQASHDILAADHAEALAKIEATNAALAAMHERLEKLAAEPLPSKTAGSVHVTVIDKGAPAADMQQARAQFEDGVTKAMAGMTGEQRAMLLIKASQQLPKRVQLPWERDAEG